MMLSIFAIQSEALANVMLIVATSAIFGQVVYDIFHEKNRKRDHDSGKNKIQSRTGVIDNILKALFEYPLYYTVSVGLASLFTWRNLFTYDPIWFWICFVMVWVISYFMQRYRRRKAAEAKGNASHS